MKIAYDLLVRAGHSDQAPQRIVGNSPPLFILDQMTIVVVLQRHGRRVVLVTVADRSQSCRVSRAVLECRQVGATGESGFQGEDVIECIEDVGLPDDFLALGIARPLSARALPRATELSRYPSVRRDLAFVVAEEVSWAALAATARDAAGPLLRDIQRKPAPVRKSP